MIFLNNWGVVWSNGKLYDIIILRVSVCMCPRKELVCSSLLRRGWMEQGVASGPLGCWALRSSGPGQLLLFFLLWARAQPVLTSLCFGESFPLILQPGVLRWRLVGASAPTLPPSLWLFLSLPPSFLFCDLEPSLRSVVHAQRDTTIRKLPDESLHHGTSTDRWR